MALEPEKTELLIEQVKSHPMLYDKEHENFKDVGTKNKLWELIARNMDETDGVAMKNKWKNLRDAFIKHVRSHKVHHGLPLHLVKQYKTWPWAPHMSFLRPYVKYVPRPRARARKDPLDASPTPEELLVEEVSDDNSPAPQHPPQSTRKRPLNNNSSTATKVKPAASKPPQSIRVVPYLSRKYGDFDDIDLIFMGYAKTVKKLSKNRQATIKFQIAKLIMESELDETRDETDDSNSVTDEKPFHQNDNNFFLFSEGEGRET